METKKILEVSYPYENGCGYPHSSVHHSHMSQQIAATKNFSTMRAWLTGSHMGILKKDNKYTQDGQVRMKGSKRKCLLSNDVKSSLWSC